jgi:nanoRNase/pAp phosphatase (c-di-AMP/oligoRNAs hydrolase)
MRANNSCNLDISKIAKKYGGGGHPKASGFMLNDINNLKYTKWENK